MEIKEVGRAGGVLIGRIGWCSVLVAMCLLNMVGANALAFEIPTESRDLQVRWDNTFRYTYNNRVQDQDKKIIANPNSDDGDRNFDTGTVSNRLDVLSEFDVIYKRKHGFRVSAAGWYDNAYEDFDNNSLATSNHLDSNLQPSLGIDDDIDDRYRGPDGEILDAFVFTRFSVGGMPVNIKLGRHTKYWGESLLLGGAINGVSYGQSPIDVAKGLGIPGVEVKELFRPLNALTVNVQPHRTFSIEAQYYLEWEQNLLPQAGTYLGFADALQEDGESVIVGPGQRLTRASKIDPDDDGDWGISARWSPDVLDGTVGFYYRNFSDTLPQTHVRPGAIPMDAATCTALGFAPLPGGVCYINPAAATVPELMSGKVGDYKNAYADDIDLYGISLTKNIMGISVGAEFSYRENMPLISEPVNVLPFPLSMTPGTVSAYPSSGDTGGARGNTMHAVLNFIGIIGPTPMFDKADYLVEFAWNRWDKVTDNKEVFKGRSGYNDIDKVDRNSYEVAVNFTPTWFQVFPSVDIKLPLTFSRGLSGNSAVIMGASEDAGNYSVGVGAELYSNYFIDLKYIDFFGDYSKNPDRSMKTFNGPMAALSDRDMISLTLKTTF